MYMTLIYILQGPCSHNQLALAHSRLWDAVGGFLYIFAHMQDKLSKVRMGVRESMRDGERGWDLEILGDKSDILVDSDKNAEDHNLP